MRLSGLINVAARKGSNLHKTKRMRELRGGIASGRAVNVGVRLGLHEFRLIRSSANYLYSAGGNGDLGWGRSSSG